MMKLLNWTLNTILGTPLLFWACIVVNVLGALYGVFVWYWPMIEVSPGWAFAFIPVCPLAALAGSAALLGLRFELRQPWLTALAALACIMWGIWTLLFWSRHWLLSGQIELIEIGLVIAHIGLICEGILLATRVAPIGWGAKLGVLAWLWVSFYVHYGLDLHPPLTPFVSRPFVFWVSLLLLIPLSLGLLALPTAERRASVRASAA